MCTFYRSENILYAQTGCFLDTVDKFELSITKTHGDNPHAKNYRAAIAFAKSMLEIK
jgi:hypothetical protein